MATARKIIAFDRVSADGYFATPDGGLDWVVPDDELDALGAQGSADVDTVLFGRRTYDMFESFWPRVAASGAGPDPHMPGRQSKHQAAFAAMLNEATKLVFSRTRQEATMTWKGSRLLGAFDPRAVAALKAEPGKDMIVFGSGSIVSLLTEHGLVDEYHFVVSPVLLGAGKLLVSGAPSRRSLRLLEARAFPSGNVMLRYAGGR